MKIFNKFKSGEKTDRKQKKNTFKGNSKKKLTKEYGTLKTLKEKLPKIEKELKLKNKKEKNKNILKKFIKKDNI